LRSNDVGNGDCGVCDGVGGGEDGRWIDDRCDDDYW